MSRIQDSIRNIKAAEQPAGKKDKKGRNKRSKSANRTNHARAVSGALPSSVDALPKAQKTWLDKKHLDNARIIHENSEQDAIAPYKMLRTRALQRMDRSEWRTMAVTASHESAGKTMTAINLAITIAQSGNRNVYLLDLDLRKPGVARALGMLDLETGIGDYLSGDANLKDVIWGVGIDNLFVVPGIGRFYNSSELITSELMSDLVWAIRNDPSEPIVIIDLPPALAADDALAIGPIVDALLFVVAESETKRAEITKSLQILKDVNLLGVVLNKSKDPHPGY